MAGNNIKWRHYRILSKQAELELQFTDLSEFIKFALENQVINIFCVAEKDVIVTFGMAHKGGLMTVAAAGFSTLTDAYNAQQQGFITAAEYYDATAKGFATAEAYALSKETGLPDPETYALMKEQHYLEGYESYQEAIAAGNIDADLLPVKNAFELYTAGTSAGFSNWFELLPALEKGFTEATEYRASNASGYPNASAYRSGQTGGFVNGAEWQSAMESGCESRLEYRTKTDLESMDAHGLMHDARVLLRMLSKLPQDKQVPLRKLEKLLEDEMALFQDPESRLFRPWFTQQLRSPKQLVSFLRKEERVKDFGAYQHDREVFKTHRIQDRSVVLDGSNVAHNSHVDHKSKPEAKNLKLMWEYLNNKGFKEIKVIVDASLKHQVSDPEVLTKFAEKCDYFEVPSNTSADVFVIGHVKKFNCLMVSNDKFREWKKADPWIEDNIDFYRLTFRINGNKILMPELQG